ncbi:MAG: zinc ribbon domain-containing protein [Candidatus Eremiobacteraeota bacterium]|nr:zinc ribbon domain-containing protein [Candidatus Eremiobacteraeota bacterium]
MPIYEFCCTQCESTFEKIVRSTTTEIVCPGCGSDKVEKKFSTFAVSSGSRGSDLSSAHGASSSRSGCSSCSSHRCSTCH